MAFAKLVIGPAIAPDPLARNDEKLLARAVFAGARIGLERRQPVAIDRFGARAGPQCFEIGVDAPDLAQAPAQNYSRSDQSEGEREDRHRHLRTLAAPGNVSRKRDGATAR